MTETDIIDALRKMGAFVQQINGSGAPDLLVFWRNIWVPIEVKSKKGRIRNGQQQYPIVRSVEEAMALFQIR